jgi:hypothetical protein
MKKWFESIDHYFNKARPVTKARYKFKFINEVPDEIPERIIYIVGDRPHYWMLCFKCPCGCGDNISLNLLNQRRPCWRFVVRWGRLTITPSIWRKVGCKSHFHVRLGKIQWSYV